MAYIVFVNPAILSAAGMPFAAVAVATALAAAIFTLLMGLLTNLPFALASGLGLNAVVAFDLILGRKLPWPVAMACVVIEGVVALVLVLAGLREAIMRAVPHEIKLSIGVGIGLFITLVGLRDAGITVNNDGDRDRARRPHRRRAADRARRPAGDDRPDRARRSRGDPARHPRLDRARADLRRAGAAGQGRRSARARATSRRSATRSPPDNLLDALTWALVPVIFVLFVSDFFDTIGTAVAVSTAGGLLDEDGQPPRLQRLLLVDSAAAAGGGAMGVSSVTTYVESGAGVAEGARTGLASLVTAVCFVLTIFFVPLIAVVGADGDVGEAQLHPAIAPALIMIGYLMIRLVADIDWSRPEAGIPAFLVIAGVPLTFSIAAGIGLGVLGYVAVMAGDGPRPRGAPADVGARSAVPRLLRLGLAERERVLSRIALRPAADKTAHMDEFAIGATFAEHIIRGVAGRGGMGDRLSRDARAAQARGRAEGDRARRLGRRGVPRALPARVRGGGVDPAPERDPDLPRGRGGRAAVRDDALRRRRRPRAARRGRDAAGAGARRAC